MWHQLLLKRLNSYVRSVRRLNGAGILFVLGICHINLYHSNLHPCKDDYRKEQTVNFNDKILDTQTKK